MKSRSNPYTLFSTTELIDEAKGLSNEFCSDLFDELLARLETIHYMVEATVDGHQPDLFPLEDSLDDD